MKHLILLAVAAGLLLSSCNKAVDTLIEKAVATGMNSNPSGFVQHVIQKGGHNSNQSSFSTFQSSELTFIARFDSSAIYRTQTPENQYDINKLYGFADNNTHHHQYSARFGWAWNNNALRLYAYVYNEGKVSSRELTTITIGEEIKCSIRVTEGSYVFTVNDIVERMPRQATTSAGKGYLLYPYFGGDETAPHDIRIWIKKI